MISVVGLVSFVSGAHDNFCRPLEDYGPRSDTMEERQVCQTSFEKDCQPVTVSDCMDVTELRCEVNLFTNCSMDWQMKDSVESLMSVKTTDLKNCTKEMVIEYHNKTIYDCKNVTKRHCTTLWTVNDAGQKIWTGNEDDCRDVTWEECNPVEKQVPMAVAQMVCEDTPVSYFDYENTTTPRMADTMDCTVDKRVVCEPVTTKKCAEVTYTKCEETGLTSCSVVTIPVPSQPKLHKQWCLFDNSDSIDFDREVRKIAGAAEDSLEKVGDNNREGKKIPDDDVEELESGSEKAEANASLDLSVEEIDNFLSQLTLLDVQSPVKRDLEPFFGDFGQIQDFARGVKEKERISMKNKRNTESRRRNHKHRNKKIANLSKATVHNKISTSSEKSKQ